MSAPQRHSLCARRTAIAQSPARPHPSRDTAHRCQNIPSAREPHQPAAAQCRHRAASRLASPLSSLQRAAARFLRPSLRAAVLKSSAGGVHRAATPRAIGRKRRKARDASCDEVLRGLLGDRIISGDLAVPSRFLGLRRRRLGREGRNRATIKTQSSVRAADDVGLSTSVVSSHTPPP